MTKREAIESFVESRFDAIPQEWVRIVMESKGEYHSLPMWGTMWFIDSLWGEKLYNDARIMVGCNEDINIEDVEQEKREEVKEALSALEKENISWGECALLEDYVNEEMANERCVLDKDGRTTAVYIYEIEGEYLIGVHGAGWSFYDGVWDMLYDVCGLQWHNQGTNYSSVTLGELLGHANTIVRRCAMSILKQFQREESKKS